MASIPLARGQSMSDEELKEENFKLVMSLAELEVEILETTEYIAKMKKRLKELQTKRNTVVTDIIRLGKEGLDGQQNIEDFEGEEGFGTLIKNITDLADGPDDELVVEFLKESEVETIHELSTEQALELLTKLRERKGETESLKDKLDEVHEKKEKEAQLLHDADERVSDAED